MISATALLNQKVTNFTSFQIKKKIYLNLEREREREKKRERKKNAKLLIQNLRERGSRWIYIVWAGILTQREGAIWDTCNSSRTRRAKCP